MNRLRSEKGFTVLELLAVMGIMTVFFGIAFLNLLDFEQRAESGAKELSRFMKQSRAKAMTATLAYQVLPISAGRIVTRSASNCGSSTWTDDEALILDLPDNLEMDSLAWSICFKPRGIADDNITVALTDDDGDTKTVEVMLGGGIRVY